MQRTMLWVAATVLDFTHCCTLSSCCFKQVQALCWPCKQVHALCWPCRREVMDAYLRDRAEKQGANVINGLMMRMEQPGEKFTEKFWREVTNRVLCYQVGGRVYLDH